MVLEQFHSWKMQALLKVQIEALEPNQIDRVVSSCYTAHIHTYMEPMHTKALDLGKTKYKFLLLVSPLLLLPLYMALTAYLYNCALAQFSISSLIVL